MGKTEHKVVPEVKSMKQKPNLPSLCRRLGAASMAVGTLWAVSITAGSDTATAAMQSLRMSFPLTALKWELGDLWTPDALSPAAALTIGESALLLSARPAVVDLWTSELEERPSEVGKSEKITADPIQETPLDVESPPQTDNGVAAKTLIPTDPSGYTVWNRVYISTSTNYDLSTMDFAESFDAQLSDDGPQILILHTHGSEAYTPPPGTEVNWSGDHRSTDSRYNVVRVGDQMAEVFSDSGISVLHDRTLYDYPSYSGAYDRALAAIQTNLTQYPSIHFILDIHRDAIEDEQGTQYKVISEVEGVGTAAQMTLVMGSDGSGLTHEHWRENLRFAANLQQNILQSYPTLMRPLLLRKSRYNQHATTGSLLLEVGAAGNSPEEAALAGRLFAERMVAFLEGLNK